MNPGNDALLTFSDGAKFLAVSLRQFRRFVDEQKISIVRLSPRAPRVRWSDLQAFIARHTEGKRELA